jgi:isopenicillin N synthase-like dioxygenase
MSLTLGEASRQSGFAKSSLSKAIGNGRLSAVRLEKGVFAIDEAELARFVEANAPPVRVVQHQLVEMTAQRDRWEVALQARLTISRRVDATRAAVRQCSRPGVSADQSAVPSDRVAPSSCLRHGVAEHHANRGAKP